MCVGPFDLGLDDVTGDSDVACSEDCFDVDPVIFNLKSIYINIKEHHWGEGLSILCLSAGEQEAWQQGTRASPPCPIGQSGSSRPIRWRPGRKRG